jgi:hypothetical protein
VVEFVPTYYQFLPAVSLFDDLNPLLNSSTFSCRAQRNRVDPDRECGDIHEPVFQLHTFIRCLNAKQPVAGLQEVAAVFFGLKAD